jgi:hypothetical protein
MNISQTAKHIEALVQSGHPLSKKSTLVCIFI